MDEKRERKKPLPPNVKKFLNDAQQSQLSTIEGFGWNLKFIRRPLFQNPVVVVVSPDGHSVGILEDDGRLNLEPDIEIRP